TENETNGQRLYGTANGTPYVKDAFHDYVMHGNKDAVSPKGVGTKAAAYYRLDIPPGGEMVVRLRLLADKESPREIFGPEFDRIFDTRIKEADDYYRRLNSAPGGNHEQAIIRQAYAGLLWSKQFYHYVVKDWLQGDPEQPAPPAGH